MAQDALVKFSDAIITDAEEKRRNYIAKLKQSKTETLRKKREELRSEYCAYIQSEYMKCISEAGLEVSQRRNELKRALILLRGEMFDKIFGEITENIKKYAETEEYRSKIKRQLDEAMEGFVKGVTVCVARECDIEALKSSAKEKNVEFAKAENELLGGFTLRNDEMKLFLDCTLNTKLEEQKEQFYVKSGLVIE